MAALICSSSGVWRIRFRYAGRQFYRSLDTRSERDALQAKAQVEETIGLLNRGRISVPDNATLDEAGQFILSGGREVRPRRQPRLRESCTLSQAAEAYFESFPPGSKAESSLSTERSHRDHLLRILGRGTQLREIGVEQLQSYVNSRSQQNGKTGQKVQPVTIRKELATFRQIRNCGKSRGWVESELPLKDVRLPRDRAKPPFQTWEEIQREVARLAPEDRPETWENLFLREAEILKLLDHVRDHARHAFVYPMFAFAALTGARRSEILRSHLEDFDLDRKLVRIRERKRRHDASESFRYVQIGDRLERCMRGWLSSHPGGRYTVCQVPDSPLTKDRANHHFAQTLADSKWSVLKGFHTLRHSFASVCAMKGIPDAIINAWMGHMTNEMRDRYRHLAPEQTQAAMATLFGDPIRGAGSG